MIPLIPDFIDDASHSYDAMSPHATVPSTPYKEGPREVRVNLEKWF